MPQNKVLINLILQIKQHKMIKRTWSCLFINTTKLFNFNFKHTLYPVCKQFSSTAVFCLKKEITESDGFDTTKAKLITQMNFKTTEHALPFYKLPISKLIVMIKRIKQDEETGFCKNRLYYIAERLQYPASLLSEPVSRRTFVYTLSSQWLASSIDVLNEFGISGERIARDLWVLKYHHATIRQRLEHVKSLGVDHLYPWMVRCSQDILNRSIQISMDTKNILGDNQSTQMYLARRLNVSMEAVEEMCTRFPSLRTIRVTKVKSFLDYLISEGFTLEEIARKPRVLTASQRTVQQRVQRLRALGVQPVNLNIVCKSVSDFTKYCDTLKFAERLKETDNIIK